MLILSLKKASILFLSLLFVFAIAACGTQDTSDEGAQDTPAQEPVQEPAKEEPAKEEEVKKLTMGFVPSQDADKIADTVEPLAKRLSEILGVEVEARVMIDYVGLVEGMRTQQIDIGFLPPFGFVQAEERAEVQVILKAVRNGADSYRAQFNVRAELEDIQTVEDLLDQEGLRWAYGDTTSTSGYLFPANELMQMGIADLDRHFIQTSVGGHDTSIIALLNGDADIATTYEDARTRVEKDHPNVMEDVRVIGFTAPIPNDTISVRSGLSDEWRDKIKAAFLSFNDEPAMIEVMSNVYNWTGIAEAKSEDYDVVRSTYENFREQLSK